MLEYLSKLVMRELSVVVIRATTSGIPEKVTSNGIDRGWRFVIVIDDGIPCGGNTMVVEGIA